MLRVVRDLPGPSSPDPPDPSKPKDDPRVVALLDRFTMESDVPKPYMFLPDDAVLLTWGLRGHRFSDADLTAIEAWLRENNPLDRKSWSVRESMRRLDAFVEEQLAKVSDPSWLRDPLTTFGARVKSAQRVQGADCNPRLLRAVFVAFMTIRA